MTKEDEKFYAQLTVGIIIGVILIYMAGQELGLW